VGQHITGGDIAEKGGKKGERKKVIKTQMPDEALHRSILELSSRLNEFIGKQKALPSSETVSKVSTSVTEEPDRLIRLAEVLTYIPVAKSTWWAGVKSGRYPAPVHHLGPRITAWKLSSILSLVREN